MVFKIFRLDIQLLRKRRCSSERRLPAKWSLAKPYRRWNDVTADLIWHSVGE